MSRDGAPTLPAAPVPRSVPVRPRPVPGEMAAPPSPARSAVDVRPRPTSAPHGATLPAGAPSPPADPAPSGRVALVHFGNSGGLGTTRRVRVWSDLLRAAGFDVAEVNLLADHRLAVPSPGRLVGAARGTVVPEAAAWSVRSVRRALRDMDPDATVFVTARAFHPELAGCARTAVLDLQDRFSRSYRGRARVDDRLGASTAWWALGWAAGRFERRGHGVHLVAAGWSEAREIGATWIPNTVDVADRSSITDHGDAEADLLFFGKLSALPNLDALRTLGALWPYLAAGMPQVRCLVAGADPNAEVRALALRHGWAVEAGFDEVARLGRRARVAVVPLRYANGIQNKVLEAAGVGIPQVVSPQATGGLLPGFPAVVAGDGGAALAGIRRLLAEPGQRLDLALSAHEHVAEHYSRYRWAARVHELVAG